MDHLLEQSTQVAGVSTLQAGYYPLAPWAGFAVLCGYTMLALGLAILLPHRKEAMSRQAVRV